MKKSLTSNVIYSGIKTASGVVFPIIIYKFATTLFSMDAIGTVEFSKSVVSYFLLLAGLGISTYAIRNGSKYREQPLMLEKFSQEIFGINCVTSLIAYSVLIISCIFIDRLNSNFKIIFIFSLEIPLALIGVDWLFNIEEDFKYITIRSIICQITATVGIIAISLKILDVRIYAVALVIATYGGNVFNFFRSRKYIKIKPVLNKNFKTHIKPMLIMFSNSLASIIYTNSDITILGFMTTGNDVALYSTAVKVYNAFKQIVSAIMTACLPRLSFYYQNGKIKEYSKTLSNIIRILFLFVPAFIISIIMQGKNIILFISSPKYIDSVSVLNILAFTLIFSSIGMLCSSMILLPSKNENAILKSTTIGAVINIVLNVIVIDKIGYIGAALTTLISEAIVSIIG
jgi:O-antigen/teichoic acid export membrane protein